MMDQTNYTGADAYIESKLRFVRTVSQGMREAFSSTWCVAESGTCGPSFYVDGIEGGFTAIAVAGPNSFYREQLFRTGHGERERNMHAFAEAALQLLVDCLEEQHASPSHPTALASRL